MCGVARKSVLLNGRQQDDTKQPFIADKKKFMYMFTVVNSVTKKISVCIAM